MPTAKNSKTPAGPFLVRTSKGSVLIQTHDQVREYLSREEHAIVEVSSTVQNWKIDVEQAKRLFQVGDVSSESSRQLANLATKTIEISSDIVRVTDRLRKDAQESKPAKEPLSAPVGTRPRQDAWKRRRMDPIPMKNLIGAGFFLIVGSAVALAFMRGSRAGAEVPPSGVQGDALLSAAQDATVRPEPAVNPPAPALPEPKMVQSRVPAPEAKGSRQTPPASPAKPPVADLIAVNADHFGRRISWVGQFEADAQTGKATIPCLMRVQNLAANDPFLWSSAMLIYRIERGSGVLLRIVEYINGDKDRRREYDYLSTPVELHGTKRFDLEFFASTDPDRGRVRMRIDGLPVTWIKLAVNDIANPRLNREKAISTTLISGDVPTLFTSKARWVARGDGDGPGYSYSLTANEEISDLGP